MSDRADVYLVVSGDTGTIHALGPPEAVEALQAIIAERDDLRAENTSLRRTLDNLVERFDIVVDEEYDPEVEAWVERDGWTTHWMPTDTVEVKDDRL